MVDLVPPSLSPNWYSGGEVHARLGDDIPTPRWSIKYTVTDGSSVMKYAAASANDCAESPGPPANIQRELAVGTSPA